MLLLQPQSPNPKEKGGRKAGGLREPSQVGQELLDFAEGEHFTSLLHKAMCQHCDADECDDCPGMAIQMHIENQIGKLGIAFMKQLLKEWVDAQKGKVVEMQARLIL